MTTLGLVIPSAPSSLPSSGLNTPSDRTNSAQSTAPTSPSSSPPGELAEDVKPTRLGFGTRAIHVGSEPDPATGAVIPPISLSTTFAQSAPGVHSGFEYSRSDNPNRRALETALASVEAGGKEALAFASGSAALATVVQSLQYLKDPSSPHAAIHVLSINDVYGGTYRYLKRVANEVQGLQVTLVDMETADEETIKNAIRDDTKLILVETPTNPTLKLVSIPLLSRLAHTHPAHPILMVDNTFASPFYQNPLMLGADIVLHSLTKYVNGHSDVVMGGVIVPDVEGSHLAGATPFQTNQGTEEDARHTPIPHPNPAHLKKYFDTLRFMQNALGAVPSAYDSWLAQRGLKTLHLRMKAHGRNALAVARTIRAWVRETNAKFPEGVEVEGKKQKVEIKVGYAGLPVEEFDFVDVQAKKTQENRHALAWRMLSEPARLWVEDDVRPLQLASSPSASTSTSSPPPQGFPYTGMLTLTLPTYAQALKFLTALHLFTLAESLGGVESLAEHPASMTHAGIPAEERRASGVEDGLVRMSVGVEETRDLVADVRRALGVAFGLEC